MARQEVVAWNTAMFNMPFGQENRLWVCVTYANGKRKLLTVSFKDRPHLDQYIGRFHPELLGKEKPNQNEHFALFSPLENQ